MAGSLFVFGAPRLSTLPRWRGQGRAYRLFGLSSRGRWFFEGFSFRVGRARVAREEGKRP